MRARAVVCSKCGCDGGSGGGKQCVSVCTAEIQGNGWVDVCEYTLPYVRTHTSAEIYMITTGLLFLNLQLIYGSFPRMESKRGKWRDEYLVTLSRFTHAKPHYISIDPYMHFIVGSFKVQFTPLYRVAIRYCIGCLFFMNGEVNTRRREAV